MKRKILRDSVKYNRKRTIHCREKYKKQQWLVKFAMVISVNPTFNKRETISLNAVNTLSRLKHL